MKKISSLFSTPRAANAASRRSAKSGAIRLSGNVCHSMSSTSRPMLREVGNTHERPFGARADIHQNGFRIAFQTLPRFEDWNVLDAVSLSLVHKPPHTCYALLIKTYARLPQV